MTDSSRGIERRCNLRIKTERLIMQDRYAHGRPAEHLGDFEQHYRAAEEMMLAGLKRLNQLLDTML